MSNCSPLGPRLVALLVLSATLSCCGPADPPDASLAADFRKNKSAYEAVLQVLAANPAIARVEFVASARGWAAETTPADIEPSRRQALMNFHRLTLVQVVQADVEQGQVASASFTLFRRGLGVSGISKGVAYFRDPTELSRLPGVELRSSCDTIPDRNGALAYCHIEGHWYLYLSD